MTYNINKQYTFSFYDAMLNVDDDYYKPMKYINTMITMKVKQIKT